jgi:ABC-type Fe3+ transport system permease subunit
VVQLGLGAVGLRTLFWVLLPFLAVGAVAGVAYYAAEGNGTVLDI